MGKEKQRRSLDPRDLKKRLEEIKDQRNNKVDLSEERIKKQKDIIERRKIRNEKIKAIREKREYNNSKNSGLINKLKKKSIIRNNKHINSYKIEEVKIENFSTYKKKDRVFIIGGGESIKNINLSLLSNEDTIVINKSFFDAPNPNFFITMDNSFSEKISKPELDILKDSHCKKIFIANFSNNRLKQEEGFIYDPKFKIKYNLSFFDHIIKANGNNFLGNDIDSFYTGNNSGFCALQLAILLEYKEIYLLGIDLQANNLTHFHGGYGENINRFNNKLREYQTNFIRGINDYNSKSPKSKIISLSDNSILNNYIPCKSFNDFFDDKEILNNSLSDLIVVGYYTINTPYEKEAQKTISSCKKLGLDNYFLGISNLGNWQANTRYKAKFMLEMLDKFPDKKLLYVDCDSIIHKYPILFKNYKDCDVSVRYQDFRWRKNECLSGTIYMNNNNKTRNLCKLWMKYNEKEGNNANTFEQWNLGNAIQHMIKNDNLIFKNLPPEYCFIFDLSKKIYPNIEGVIVHYQASRKFKNKV